MIRTKDCLWILFFWSISCYSNSDTGEQEITFSGYVKSYLQHQDSYDIAFLEFEENYTSQTAIRFMLDGIGKSLSWQVHYELIPTFYSRTPVFNNRTFSLSTDIYRLTDIKQVLSDANSKHPVFENLDRLNVQIKLGAGDLTIGRQAITFGSARFVNPTDVFLPFDLRTFNQEYRAGIDAIRYQAPSGQMGEIDTGVIFGQDARNENSAAYVNLRIHRLDSDIQVSLVRFSEQNLAGAGFETTMGNAGFWFEAARVFAEKNYTRVSAGFDFSLTDKTFFMLEYHYNQLSSGKPDSYLLLMNSPVYQKSGAFLLGKNYLLASLSQIINPLWNLSASLTANLNDNSSYFSIKAQYNIAEDSYIDLGYYCFSGDSAEFMLTPPFFDPGSEFGASPDLLFASVRHYF